jgi:dihydrofolate reductase
MGRIVVTEFISLDGVIQAPGGADEDTDGGFTQGAWTIPYWDDAIGERFDQAFQGADALLLGRRTWQTHAVFDTMAGDDFADAMNAIPKYVVSNTLTDTAAWRNSSVISGDDVIGQIAALKARTARDLLTDGSSVLVQAMLAAGLVDELRLLVYPVVLGGGKTIFPPGTRIDLDLAEVDRMATGVIFLRYLRATA